MNMTLKVLGISASPRLKGNSDMLLRRSLAGAESAGAQTEYLRLADLNIAPCVECNSCYNTGKCRIEDDYQAVYTRMLNAHRLIFATPIFFMTVCAQAKALIDRCQCLWAHRYILEKPLITSGPDRRGMVIAVGGSKSTKMFVNVRSTMKTYFDVLDMKYIGGLFVNKVDNLGEIEKHPSALEQAFHLGRDLVTTELPPQKPVDIEII